MTKNGIKGENTTDLGLLPVVETAKMTELAEIRPKPELSGIYGIGSRKGNIIGLWVSRSVDARVRKLKHDYKVGRKMGIIEEMGLRWQSDVVFQLMELCPMEIARLRMKVWIDKARGAGYQIYNHGDVEVKITRELGDWKPVGKVIQIMERFNVSEEDMLGMLSELERGIEHRLHRGAGG